MGYLHCAILCQLWISFQIWFWLLIFVEFVRSWFKFNCWVPPHASDPFVWSYLSLDEGCQNATWIWYTEKTYFRKRSNFVEYESWWMCTSVIFEDQYITACSYWLHAKRNFCRSDLWVASSFGAKLLFGQRHKET